MLSLNLLAAILCLAVAACGGGNSSNGDSVTSSRSSSSSSSSSSGSGSSSSSSGSSSSSRSGSSSGAGSGTALTITTTSCPDGTQGAAYAGCTISVTGGSPPYTVTVSTSPNYPPLPEALLLSSATRVIRSAQIRGQGSFFPMRLATDSAHVPSTPHIRSRIAGRIGHLEPTLRLRPRAM